MHPDHTNATVEDLWPGDVIIARRPGGCYGAPHRFVDTHIGCGESLIVRLSTLDGEFQFEAVAMDGWETRVERLA